MHPKAFKSVPLAAALNRSYKLHGGLFVLSIDCFSGVIRASGRGLGVS